MSELIHIQPFDWSTLTPNLRCLVFGQAGSGKSTVINRILFAMDRQSGRCMSVNKFTHGVEEGPPELRHSAFQRSTFTRLGFESGRATVYGTFDPDDLGAILDKREEALKDAKPSPSVVVMEDGLLTRREVTNSDQFERLMNGSKSDTGFIGSCCGLKQLSPDQISRAEIVIAFNMAGQSELLYKKFFQSVFPTFKHFQECYVPITEVPREDGIRGRRAIVIDFRRGSNVEDCIFSLEVEDIFAEVMKPPRVGEVVCDGEGVGEEKGCEDDEGDEEVVEEEGKVAHASGFQWGAFVPFLVLGMALGWVLRAQQCGLWEMVSET